MNRVNSSIKVLTNAQFLSMAGNDNYDVSIIIDPNDVDAIHGLYYIQSNKFKYTFSNVAIAAAVTAYGRMIIDPYKRIKDNKCFYSDTDSVFLQYPLSEKYVGNELG